MSGLRFDVEEVAKLTARDYGEPEVHVQALAGLGRLLERDRAGAQAGVKPAAAWKDRGREAFIAAHPSSRISSALLHLYMCPRVKTFLAARVT